VAFIHKQYREQHNETEKKEPKITNISYSVLLLLLLLLLIGMYEEEEKCLGYFGKETQRIKQLGISRRR
jgi:hypothetical protein